MTSRSCEMTVSKQEYAFLIKKSRTMRVVNDNDVERSKAMFQRILVPLDGTEGSEHAIPIAARIAHASQATIVFIRVIPSLKEVGAYAPAANEPTTVPPSTFEKDLADAASYLSETIAAYAEDLQGIPTEMDLSFGAASPTIFSTAQLEHTDLIIMCSHGETGMKRSVFGSFAQQAVRHSPVPVLVLNEHGVMLPPPDSPHPLRILVALDGSALSEAALEPLAHLLAACTIPQRKGEIHLLRVVDLPPAPGKFGSQAFIPDSLLEETRQEAETYLRTVADRLRTELLAGTTFTVTSSVAISTDVAGTIVKLAEQAEAAQPTDQYDVIAMASHGRSGLKRLIMGSVTEHVLGATKLPLLIVRPSATEAKQDEGTKATTEGTVFEEQTWVGLL